MKLRRTTWESTWVVLSVMSAGCAVRNDPATGAPVDECVPTTADEPGCPNEPGAQDAPPPAAMADSPRERVEVGDAPRLGPPGAPVTVVFAADLECDFCARASVTMKKLREAYGDRVAIVFEHHPLPMHLHAVDAAVAVEAAGQQGKFWEMADRVFAHQDRLDRASFVADAQQLGLDAARFEAALDDPAMRARVHADRSRMDAAGARGAPTFWINGRRLVGAYPLATFRSLIDEELAAL